MRLLACALVFCSAAFADLIDFGIKGGAPFTDALKTAQTGNLGYTTETRRWTIGPMIDINLPFALGIEFDALYRRLNYEASTPGSVQDIFVRRAVTANSWDFPVLLKIRFAPGPLKPYLSVGPTFRGLSNLKQAGEFIESDRPVELENRFNTGFTAGLGLRISAPVIAVAPEVRYTRWGWDNFKDVNGLLRSNRDQFEFLVGVTF
jgi:opacity protein-like surface antigen